MTRRAGDQGVDTPGRFWLPFKGCPTPWAKTVSKQPNPQPWSVHPVENLPQEGEHYDFISEHHILWEAGVKEDWEKICEVIDSQLRPMSLKRLGEQNYRRLGWHLQFSKDCASFHQAWSTWNLSCKFALDDGKNIKTYHMNILYTHKFRQPYHDTTLYHVFSQGHFEAPSSSTIRYDLPRNVITIGVRGLMYGGRALEGPVLEALQKGMKVLDYPKDRAKELVNGIPPDSWQGLLGDRMRFLDDGCCVNC